MPQITCISDLHGNYPELPGGDLLIVAGDLTARDNPGEYLTGFFPWIAKTKYKKRIVIAGNHDTLIQKGIVPMDAIIDFEYLCDSGTEFEGLKIWGSPWSLWFHGINPKCKAFTGNEEKLAEQYAKIPDDTDILVTHGPMKGFLDKTAKGEHVGSVSLKIRIWQMQNPPRLIVSGHIHEAYGMDFEDWYEFSDGHFKQQYINASHVNERYELVNKPMRIVL